MRYTTRVLSLGTREDAKTWMDGCEKIGIKPESPIRNSYPTLDSLHAFFSSTPHWIFFGGHFSSSEGRLCNEAENVNITFGHTRVRIAMPKGKKSTIYRADDPEAHKSAHRFRLHELVKVVLWGGCNIVPQIQRMRSLFGPNHLLLGFSGTIGYRSVNDALLSGVGNFFGKVAANKTNLEEVRKAWLKAATKSRQPLAFRAVDPDGSFWEIQKLPKRGYVAKKY